MTVRHRLIATSLVLFALGCQSGPVRSRFFPEVDRTTFRTPAARIDEVVAIGARANGQDTPEQQQLVTDLAQRLPSEPDPVVRETIMRSIARFNTPLVDRVLLAGLDDADPAVRRRSCQAVGARKMPAGIGPLKQALANDDDFDVRLEATRSLGEIGSPEAVQALAEALQDRDPAVQLVAVEAVRKATGQDYGNDANAYLALTRGETPAVAARPESTGSRLRSWLPF